MTKDDINWLVNLVDDRKKIADACQKCSECDIFDKCQKEGLHCEKDEDNIMKENNENDLISRRALYDKCVELEQEALKMVQTADDKTEKLIWNAVLVERSAFKFSVMDAPAWEVIEYIGNTKWKCDEDEVIETHLSILHKEDQGKAWQVYRKERK
ncbi:MAG: hypothetical protein IKF91_03095 [Bacilli bacterium]|nr:hypothetical protein [Bacilli bacterium]